MTVRAGNTSEKMLEGDEKQTNKQNFQSDHDDTCNFCST